MSKLDNLRNIIQHKFTDVEKQYNAVKHLSGSRPSYLKGQLDLLLDLSEYLNSNIFNTKITRDN